MLVDEFNINSEANSSSDRADHSLFGLIWRFRPFYKVKSCSQIDTILRVVERSKLVFLFQREKTLVALLGALGRPVNPTTFQKPLFHSVQLRNGTTDDAVLADYGKMLSLNFRTMGLNTSKFGHSTSNSEGRLPASILFNRNLATRVLQNTGYQ